MNAGGDPRDAETKATAFGMTAGIEPSEARHGMLALVGWDTRSRIRHDERDPIEPARKRHPDRPAGRRVLDRVVEQIGDDLPQQQTNAA